MTQQKVKSSEITPERIFLSRRNLIRGGLIAATSAATGLTYRFFNPSREGGTHVQALQNVIPAQHTGDVPNAI